MSVQVTVALGDDGPVAVKTATTDEDIERLRAEAALLHHAAHPGLVALVGIDEDADGAHMRTRYAGEPIDRWRGTVAQAAGLAAAVAATVGDLHEAGIVHGRLDETHVLVGSDGRPRLCGLAGLPGAGPADDVLALGRLVAWLLDRVEPERRGPLPWQRGFSAHRRALAQVAGRVLDPVPGRRPSARGVAGSILAAVPDAELPPGATPPPAPAPADDGPLWPEPPHPLPWTVVDPFSPSPGPGGATAHQAAGPRRQGDGLPGPARPADDPVPDAPGHAPFGSAAPRGLRGDDRQPGNAGSGTEALPSVPDPPDPPDADDPPLGHLGSAVAGRRNGRPVDRRGPRSTSLPDSLRRGGPADDVPLAAATPADDRLAYGATAPEGGERSVWDVVTGEGTERTAPGGPDLDPAGTSSAGGTTGTTTPGGAGRSASGPSADTRGDDLAMRLARCPTATPPSWSAWSTWAAAAGLTADADAWARRTVPGYRLGTEDGADALGLPAGPAGSGAAAGDGDRDGPPDGAAGRAIQGPAAGADAGAEPVVRGVLAGGAPRAVDGAAAQAAPVPDGTRPRLVLVPGSEDGPTGATPEVGRPAARWPLGRARHPVVGLPAVPARSRRTGDAGTAGPPGTSRRRRAALDAPAGQHGGGPDDTPHLPHPALAPAPGTPPAARRADDRRPGQNPERPAALGSGPGTPPAPDEAGDGAIRRGAGPLPERAHTGLPPGPGTPHDAGGTSDGAILTGLGPLPEGPDEGARQGPDTPHDTGDTGVRPDDQGPGRRERPGAALGPVGAAVPRVGGSGRAAGRPDRRANPLRRALAEGAEARRRATAHDAATVRGAETAQGAAGAASSTGSGGAAASAAEGGSAGSAGAGSTGSAASVGAGGPGDSAGAAAGRRGRFGRLAAGGAALAPVADGSDQGGGRRAGGRPPGGRGPVPAGLPGGDDDSGTVRLEGWRDRKARQAPAPARPAPAAGRARRAAVTAAAGTLGVALVAGGLLAMAPGERPAGDRPGPAAGDGGGPDGCPRTEPPAGDVDGDGCPDPLVVEGHVVSSGDARWSLGEAGDVVAVGDWDCDGAASPAVLRPETGDVFVFPGWATDEAPVTVDAVRTIPGAEVLRPEPGADGCDALVVERAGGEATVVEEARA